MVTSVWMSPLASLFKGRWRARTGATVGICGINVDLYLTPCLPPLSKGGQDVGLLYKKGDTVWRLLYKRGTGYGRIKRTRFRSCASLAKGRTGGRIFMSPPRRDIY